MSSRYTCRSPSMASATAWVPVTAGKSFLSNVLANVMYSAVKSLACACTVAEPSVPYVPPAGSVSPL